MFKKKFRMISSLLLVTLLTLSLVSPAFAIDESEVEAAVNATSRETVTGNVLIWFLCAVAFLKVSQKIDSFMSSLGVNVGHTGGSLLGEAMVAAKGISMMTGAAGKVVGGVGRGAHGSRGADGAPGASGAGGFFRHGLIGMAARKVSSDAVKTATSTTERAASPVKSSSQVSSAVHTAGESASAVHTATHAASEARVAGVTRTAEVSRQSTATNTEQTNKTGHTTDVRHQQATATHSSSTSSLHRASHHTSIGGRIFTNSMLSGGDFANGVIGKVATGDIRSTGSITGEFAAQALACYTGITAQGDAAPSISYSDVEIGGGRITGTEYTPEHPDGISFGLYHVEQYVKPDGDFQKVFTADGAQWYKQYAVDTVIKTPYKAPDGEVDYRKEIVKRLPDPPKRKDRI